MSYKLEVVTIKERGDGFSDVEFEYDNNFEVFFEKNFGPLSPKLFEVVMIKVLSSLVEEKD